MRMKHAATGAVFAVVLLLAQQGFLLGERFVDEFGDDERDTQLWGSDTTSGEGRLSEEDGALQFLVDQASDLDYAERPWILQNLPANQNWSVRASMEASPEHTTKEQVASLAIWIRPKGHDGELWVELYSSSIDRSGFPGPLALRHGFATSLSELPEASLDSGEIPFPSGAVRITYIAEEGSLRAWHNIGNVEEEAEWVELAHHNVSGQGDGTHANVDWQLQGGGTFEVGVYGYAENLEISRGEMKFTSFEVDTNYVPVVVEGLTAVDDRLVVPGATPSSMQESIEALANDHPVAGEERDSLVIVGLGTLDGAAFEGETLSEAGAEVTTDGAVVYYRPPEGFAGADSFTYTIEDAHGATDWARVHLRVGSPRLNEVVYSDPVDALRTTLAFLLAQLAANDRLMELYEKHRLELLLMFLNDPNLNGGAVTLPDDVGVELGEGGEIVMAQEASGGEELSAVLASFQPGLAALVTGNGGDFEISQSMVDEVKVFRDRVAANASPELKGDIAQESDRWNDLQDFVGRDFDALATMLEINLEEKAIGTVGVRREGQTFSLTLPKFSGIVYSLWQSLDLGSGGDTWASVDEIEQSSSRGEITLTDPSASEAAGFYRVEARMGDGGGGEAVQ